MENTFGKSRYDSGSAFKKRQTLKPGSNVRRVLPAFGSLAASGKWSQWVSQHFGWNGLNKNNPDKPMPRPFQCVFQKNYKTQLVLQECDACTEIEVKKEELEALEASLKAKKASQKQLDVELQPLKTWLKEHNKDNKHYINTMLENGDFELTAISNTCMTRLKEEFKRVSQKYGVDPTDVEQGVWIDFKRIIPQGGQLRDADDVPSVVMEMVTVNGQKMEQLKLAPLSDEVLRRAVQECVDLSKQVTIITPEQVTAIVSSSGSPEEIDAVFGMTQKNVEQSPEPVKVAEARVTPVKASTVKAVSTPPTVQYKAEPKVVAEAVTMAPGSQDSGSDTSKASQFAALFGE